MAEDATATPRTLTEHEAYAIAADRVQRETADLNAKVETLTTEKAELSSKLDVAEATLAIEKTAREKAEKDLEDFKGQVETERQVASRRDSRTAKVREVAAHLPADFFTDERITRWALMDDAAFDATVAEMAALANVSVPAGTSTGTAPRQTAMNGAPVVKAPGAATAQRLFDLRRGGAA